MQNNGVSGGRRGRGEGRREQEKMGGRIKVDGKEKEGRSRRQLIEKEEVKGEEERRKKRKGYIRKRRSMYQWRDILLAEQMVLQ